MDDPGRLRRSRRLPGAGAHRQPRDQQPVGLRSGRGPIALGGRERTPRNDEKSRPLADKIFEFKTRGGIRIPYFYDKDRLVICIEAMRKPKKTELHAVIARALAARERYFEAKRRGAVEMIQEGS